MFSENDLCKFKQNFFFNLQIVLKSLKKITDWLKHF